jgi:PhzF family phenazine biosynthesis protein
MRPEPGGGTPVAYRHVDVFADEPFRGNGLVVVFAATADVAPGQLRVVTQEMRQFETIFVAPEGDSSTVQARIFTVEEELPFAGHPVIGAAAALHERLDPDADTVEWQFRIHGRPLRVVSQRDDVYYDATMDQGIPDLSDPMDERRGEVTGALDLTLDDLAPLPLQMISTGCPT